MAQSIEISRFYMLNMQIFYNLKNCKNTYIYCTVQKKELFLQKKIPNFSKKLFFNIDNAQKREYNTVTIMLRFYVRE